MQQSRVHENEYTIEAKVFCNCLLHAISNIKVRHKV